MQKVTMFRLLKLSCLSALVLPLGALASSCSNLADKCENTNTCSEPGGDAGDAGACNDPATQPCAISNERGVFVSAANGSDTEGTGDGTREKPYRSIGKALAAAKMSKKNVYVCAGGGEYAESDTLTIDAAFSGVSLFGGFNCTDWTYRTTLKSKIISGSPNPITVEGVTSGTISDFEVQAADATEAGASSLAVQVKSSQRVTLRRLKVTAGRGADGAVGTNGPPGADGSDPIPTEQNGKPADCSEPDTTQPGGAPSTRSLCGSRGGKGGNGVLGVVTAASDGESGSPTTNLTLPNADNHGKGEAEAVTSKQGGEGSPGKPGGHGTSAPVTGAWTAAGYTAASGLDGTPGSPGQGGGGGGASRGSATCAGASGGAGGMGGCGGGAGRGGGGGGASVAVFVWQSTVTIEDCELISKDAGNGGNGGNAENGGSGASGGSGGTGFGSINSGGRGGDGGRGGAGGSGAGGTGGPSYALVSPRTGLTQVGTNTLTPGKPGTAGQGGSLLGLGEEEPAPAGHPGETAGRLELP